MKRILNRTMVVLVSVLVSVACTKQPSSVIPSDFLENTGFLSDAEMKDVERVFSTTDSRKYDYRVLHVKRQDADGRELVTREERDLDGLLFLRDKKHLRPLGGNFYDDGRGNLVYFGDQIQVFAMTYMANGDDILAVDTDRNGVIDSVIGTIGDDDLWLASSNIANLLPCLSSSGGSVHNAFLECSRPETPGGAGGADAGGGSGINSGFNPDLLGEPVCPPNLLGNVVDGEGPATPPGEDPAPPPPPPSEESPEDDDYPPMGVNETVTTEADGRQSRVVTIRTAEGLVEQSTSTNDDGSVIRTTIHRDSQGRETYREDILVGPGPERRLLMHRVNQTTYDADGNPSSTVVVNRKARSGTSLPPIDPNGGTVFSDPRCAGRDIRASQGLSFLDLCAEQGSIDFLTCYRELENPLFSITGGRCIVVGGPADGRVFDCRSNRSTFECIAAGGSPEECARSASGGEGGISGPGGPDSGPTDAPGLPGNAGTSEIRYIDTIPLGALLMGLCSRGGCRDPRPF